MARKRRSRPGPTPTPPRTTHGRNTRAGGTRSAGMPVRPRRPKPAAKTSLLPPAGVPDLRVGHGYDLHRLEAMPPHGFGRPLVIGGVMLPPPLVGTDPVGPVAHSDGDVLYHALVDALLGALALPDIGQLFPNTAHENEGRDSAEFVRAAVAEVAKAGFRVLNVDATVIVEQPKIGPVKAQIRANIAGLLGLPVERVNLKGKTHEGVDAVGQGRAIEAHVVVLMVRG